MSDDVTLPQERRSRLLDMLAADGRIVAADAAREFGVSEDSIRRDLRALASEGLALRVHGGALPAAPATPLSQRKPAPAALVRALAGRISEASGLVLLDASVSVLAAAHLLEPHPTRTIATSSPAVAAAASARGVRVLTIGGMVDPEVGAALDVRAVDALRGMRADLVVLGACALHAEHGITADRAEEVPYKRALLAAAGEVVVPAALSKLGTVAPYPVASADAVATVLTDAPSDDPHVVALRNAGVTVDSQTD